MTLLLSILGGIVLPTLYMLAVGLHRCRCCRCLGHDWERCQIDGAHYRDPTSLPLRVCKRCERIELVDEAEGFALAELEFIAAKISSDLARVIPTKPRPTPLPSDGESCNR